MREAHGQVEYWDDRRIRKYLDQRATMEHLKTFTKMDFRRERKIRQAFQNVRASVCNLPFGEMAVVYMRFWEELTLADIALELELSIQFVERLLASALEHLKDALKHLQPQYKQCA